MGSRESSQMRTREEYRENWGGMGGIGEPKHDASCGCAQDCAAFSAKDEEG